MELLYVWIAEHLNICEQGFHFSPLWQFDYTNNQLSVSKREDYPCNFFGNSIINVTAIVGENGVGKTNLLEFLYSIDWKKPELWKQKMIIAIKSGSKNYLFYHDDIPFNNQKAEIVDFEIQPLSTLWNKKPQSIYDAIKVMNCIFYSNIFDSRILDKKQQYSGLDFTTNFFGEDGGDGGVIKYKIQEYRRQINFASRVINYRIPFPLPQYVIIRLTYNDKYAFLEEKLSEIQKKDEHKKSITHLNHISEIIENKLSKIQDKFILHFQINLVYLLISNMFLQNKEIDISEKISNLAKSLDVDTFSQEFQLFIKETYHHLKFNHCPLEQIINFINDVILLVKNEKGVETQVFDDYYKEWEEELGNEKKDIVLGLKIHRDYWDTNLKTLLNIYDPILLIGELFSFEWNNISSGESAFLSLFSRFFEHKKEIETWENILFIIDEGEVGFHPQWQKQYLSYILNFFNDVIFCNTSNAKVQIILTSHSPFLISDLPKENIIFLRKGNLLQDTEDKKSLCIVSDGISHHRTLGANIHTLLSDSFFLQGGLIGEFAKQHINNVINLLKPLVEYESKIRDLKFQEEFDIPKFKQRISENTAELLQIEKLHRNSKEEEKKLNSKKNNLNTSNNNYTEKIIKIETAISSLEKDDSTAKANFNKEENYVKYIISKIGEPIVQNKLTDMYSTIKARLGDSLFLDEEITQLQERIDALKEKKKSLL